MESVVRLLGPIVGPLLLHLPPGLLAASPLLCALVAYGLARQHRRLFVARAKELKRRR